MAYFMSEENTNLVTADKDLLPDPDKLRSLANYVDKQFPNDQNPKVQTDLRKWADYIDTI
jgi:hypothetical protein